VIIVSRSCAGRLSASVQKESPLQACAPDLTSSLKLVILGLMSMDTCVHFSAPIVYDARFARDFSAPDPAGSVLFWRASSWPPGGSGICSRGGKPDARGNLLSA